MILRICLIIYIGLLCFSIEVTSINKRTVNCPYETIVIFGDSTCDNGNTWRQSNYTYPVDKFYKGRFSNGPTWVEYLAEFCNATEINNAYGGATSDADFVTAVSGMHADMLVPGIKQQVEEYIDQAKNTKVDFDKTLYIVGYQGNDYLNKPFVRPLEIVKILYEQWIALANLGGKNILINNFFNLIYLPEVRKKLSGPKRIAVGIVSQIHNKAIGAYAWWFRRKYKDVKLFILPMDEVWGDVTQTSVKDQLGLTNFEDGCVVRDDDNFTACQDPDVHFYWDNIHPSTKIHRYIAMKAFNIILEGKGKGIEE